jgi:proprotein convertase subtilisin/kexin type 5
MLFLINNTCQYNCFQGYYLSSINQTCSPCASNCAECYYFSGGTCLRCMPGYVYYNSSCVSSCPSMHTSDANGRCIPCPTGCTSCNTVGECYGCLTGLTLTNLVCKQNCSDGMYLTSGSCVACNSACLTCNSSNACGRCANNLYLQTPGTLNCAPTCPTKFFMDNSSFICTPCPPTCSSCISASQCTGCFSFSTNLLYYYLYKGACLIRCPNGTYLDYQDNFIKTCNSCAFSCIQCFGPTVDQCNECLKGYVLDMTSCVPNCTAGKWADNSSHCDLCNPICKTCFGPTDFQCYSCNYGFYLYKYRCYEICPAGTVNSTDRTGLRICKDCPLNCLICYENLTCSTCAPPTFLHPAQN